jgi:hypothetical protein
MKTNRGSNVSISRSSAGGGDLPILFNPYGSPDKPGSPVKSRIPTKADSPDLGREAGLQVNLNQLQIFKDNISPKHWHKDRPTTPEPEFDTSDAVVGPTVKVEVVGKSELRESESSLEKKVGKAATNLSCVISMAEKKNLADDEDLSYNVDAAFDDKN